MSNLAFIVDGQMEQLIIGNLCPNKPVRLLNCNGRDVSIEAAAKRVASLIRLMRRNYPIIIIFDREKRLESSEVICKKLIEAIKSNGIHEVPIVIGVPDRMIENWILADINSVNTYYGISIPQLDFEGKGGKGQIRKLIEPHNYQETEDGPEIAKKINFNIAKSNSISLNSFLSKIIEIIGCCCLD
jgi:hypothetical protein